jgi:hypothetical protein
MDKWGHKHLMKHSLGETCRKEDHCNVEEETGGWQPADNRIRLFKANGTDVESYIMPYFGHGWITKFRFLLPDQLI